MPQQLIRNGTLINGTGRNPIEHAAVLLKDNKIVAAGSESSVTVPADATIIDAGGGTIMPGMIDTHVHVMLQDINLETMLATPFSMNFYKAAQYLKRTLDAGITSVRDAAGADLGVKMSVEQGIIPGPRMQISVTALSITGGHGDGMMPNGTVMQFFPPYPGMPSNICDGVADVRKKVREVLRAGADIIKICSTGGVLSPTDHPEFTQFSMAELEAIVEEAAFRKGIKVMSHAQGAEGVLNAVKAGIHSIEHGIFLDEEICELMVKKGTYLVPTLLAPLAVLEAGAAAGMPEYGIRKSREVIEIHSESIARAYQMGVRIAMGTDAGVMPHGTNLREMGLMCGIGMSPMESIVATTKTAAACLGWEDKVGTIEKGKLADIIVSRSDPLSDIKSLANNDNIAFVMKDGDVVKNKLAG